MTRNEPSRMTKNVYARLNGIRNMIMILDNEFEKQLKKRPSYADTEYDKALMILTADIRELRRDAQRMALQAGPQVAEWWAQTNYEHIIAQEKKK